MDMIGAAIDGMEGKRLTWKRLINERAGHLVPFPERKSEARRKAN